MSGKLALTPVQHPLADFAIDGHFVSPRPSGSMLSTSTKWICGDRRTSGVSLSIAGGGATGSGSPRAEAIDARADSGRMREWPRRWASARPPIVWDWPLPAVVLFMSSPRPGRASDKGKATRLGKSLAGQASSACVGRIAPAAVPPAPRYRSGEERAPCLKPRQMEV
jgi:hypothetical protein